MPDTVDFVGPLNLAGFELRNAKAQTLAAAPAHSSARFYYDSTLGQFGVSNGTVWSYLGAAAGLTQEQVEDIVGVMNSTSTVVTAVYDDPTGKIVLTIGAGQITNAMVSNTAAISADKTADGVTNKVFLATERTKLAGVATGATANATDAFLLARGNHTGTQLAATISDLTAAVDARVNTVVAGAPAALDTLNELALALGSDPNFATSMATALNLRPISFSLVIGDNTATTIAVTHNLNTRKFVSMVRETATPWAQKLVPNEATSLNVATFYFGAAPTVGQFEVTIIGRP